VTGERRRAPRYEITDGEPAVLLTAISVQILDISVSGALLRSFQPARVGDAGRLTLTLQGRPFTAEIEVLRVESLSAGGDCRLGVRFSAIRPEHRQAIEAFTTPRTM
jgi:hypothetical protein